MNPAIALGCIRHYLSLEMLSFAEDHKIFDEQEMKVRAVETRFIHNSLC